MNNELLSARALLRGKNINVLDAARLICNIADFMPKKSKLTTIQFCAKIIEIGKNNFRQNEMPIANGFDIYLQTKQDLRKASFSDIKYLGKKLMKLKPEFAKRNFSQLSVADCEEWLNCTFTTPSQYNKGRAMLHALFEFALRREWCDKNPIKQILRKKVIEKEILPLKLSEIRRIIANAKKENNGIYLPAVALLVFAGIRPREVRRLTWQDIDLQENTITVRSQCSKTGGIRQVEIMPQLKRILLSYNPKPQQKICPVNWQRRWQKIRNNSGFSGRWVQDVLRHTYASFFAKRFKDLPRLQLNMGHSNQMLLCSRYINMRNISRFEAEKFFN